MIRAAILAGGESRRFGSDKALAPFDGESFLGRAVELGRRLNLEPVIVAPASRGYARLFNCAVLEDEEPGLGPLGGLATLWSRFPGTFLVLTCDMPGLTAEAALGLLRTHETNYQATVYGRGEKMDPFPGVYESSLAEAARHELRAGRRSMRGFLEQIPRKKIVPWNGSEAGLANFNSPADRASRPSLSSS